MDQSQNDADQLLDAYIASISTHVENIEKFHDISRTIGDDFPWTRVSEKFDPITLKNIFRLIGKGLFRPNLFPIALRAMEFETQKYVSDRYLCDDIDYDNCPVGFTGTLKGYFSDMVDFKGEQYLLDFLRSDLVAKTKLKDKRVQNAIFLHF